MLAQLQAADPAAMGQWAIILFGIAGGIGMMFFAVNQAKACFAAPKPDDQFVTHKQFDAFKDKIERDMETLLRKVDSAEREQRAVLDKFQEYTHQAFHRMGDSQQRCVTDLAWVKGILETIARGGDFPPRTMLNTGDRE